MGPSRRAQRSIRWIVLAGALALTAAVLWAASPAVAVAGCALALALLVLRSPAAPDDADRPVGEAVGLRHLHLVE